MNHLYIPTEIITIINNSSINENLNINLEKANEQINNSKINFLLKKLNHNFCKMSDINKNKISINCKPNYNINNSNFNEEIIKYTILRNNQNNQIINEFSIVLGDEKNKSDIISENKKIKCRIDENPRIINNDNKKTIINVNQFYPSYYIDTHEISRNNK